MARSFLTLLLIFLPFLLMGQEGAWFVSNPMGMELKPWSTGNKEEWTLHRQVSGSEETLTLFHQEEVDTVWYRTRDRAGHMIRVVEWKTGAKVRESLYQAAGGLLSEEKEFLEGQLTADYHYVWTSGQVTRRQALDSTGSILYTDQFYYLTGGRLRRIERDFSQGNHAEASWSYAQDGRVLFEWSHDGDKIHFYTLTGGAVKEDLYDEAEKLLHTSRSQPGPGGFSLESQQSGSSNENKKIIKDSLGRVIEERWETQDDLISQRTWAYDEKNRITQETEQRGNLRFLSQFHYDDQGVTSVENYRNGQLVSKEDWTGGKKTRVQVYVGGQVVLEELWDDGEKVKETYYRDGQVVRTRSLKPEAGEKP